MGRALLLASEVGASAAECAVERLLWAEKEAVAAQCLGLPASLPTVVPRPVPLVITEASSSPFSLMPWLRSLFSDLLHSCCTLT